MEAALVGKPCTQLAGVLRVCAIFVEAVQRAPVVLVFESFVYVASGDSIKVGSSQLIYVSRVLSTSSHTSVRTL